MVPNVLMGVWEIVFIRFPFVCLLMTHSSGCHSVALLLEVWIVEFFLQCVPVCVCVCKLCLYVWGNPLSITISQQGSMLYKTICINKKVREKELPQNTLQVCKYLRDLGGNPKKKFVINSNKSVLIFFNYS